LNHSAELANQICPIRAANIVEYYWWPCSWSSC